MSAQATLAMVTLDCPDPGALAEFYRVVTGWEITYRDENCAMISPDNGVPIGFQKVEKFNPACWPEQAVPQQFHLDFHVDDLDKAEEVLLAEGAGKPEFQPGGDHWRVLTDPAGHPFCICLRRD